MKLFGRKQRGPVIRVIQAPPRGTDLHGRARGYDDLYGSSHAVRTVVDWLGRNLARYRVLTFRGEDPVTDDRAADLLRANRFVLLRHLASATALTGNGYAPLVLDAEGRVRGVSPTSAHVGLERPSGGVPDRYVLQTGAADPVKIEVADMVHVKLWNPTDPFLGKSPLDSLRHLLAEDEAASRDRRHFWTNSARPYGWFQEGLDGFLSDEALESWRLDWEDAHAGENEFTPAIVPKQLTYNEGKRLSPADAQFVEGRTQVLRLAAAALGIPPQLVGAETENFPGATRAIEECLAPYAKLVEAELNAKLAPRIYDDPAVEIKLVPPAPLTDRDIGQTLDAAVKAGRMTPNEARKVVGLPDHPDGDGLYEPKADSAK